MTKFNLEVADKSRFLRIAEAVSPAHPDKVADRIAGALVDYCYRQTDTPKCAFEVLIGHGKCLIIGETSVEIPPGFVVATAERISGEKLSVEYKEVPQDPELAHNQDEEPRAGDNGIFFGTTLPQLHLETKGLAQKIYEVYPHDGKLILDGVGGATICWSHASEEDLRKLLKDTKLDLKINPLGSWTGGVNVDTGLTGRKLACDFYGIGAPLGGGNMHGKDLTKADVTVNILCFLLALESGGKEQFTCRTSIGDTEITLQGSLGSEHTLAYSDAIKKAREYIAGLGGFEKFAEWGLR